MIQLSLKKEVSMSRKKGDIAEDKACEFLLDKGFEINERNFYSRFGEVDIIA